MRQGKGDKDRVTVLPDRIREGLKAHLQARRVEYEQDLKEGAGYVPLPGALARKNPATARSWSWQYVFGGQNLIVEAATGRTIRWHIHENTVGRLLGEAARRCGVVRHVTCHALRHTFATLAVEAKVRIETQHQALNAVVRFYAEVLGRKVEGVEGYPGARNTDGLFPPPPGGTALAGILAAGCPGFALQPRLRNPDVRGKWLASNYVGLEERGAGKAAHRFRISRK